jgi:hypothetical protein
MSIHFTMTTEGDLLIVKASGFDENLEDVLNYGMAVIEACKEGNLSHVLCDEIDLEYRLGTLDTFKSAETLASQVPNLGKAAIVPNEKFIADANFWETVAVNRGLTVRVFKKIDSARQWLGEG